MAKPMNAEIKTKAETKSKAPKVSKPETKIKMKTTRGGSVKDRLSKLAGHLMAIRRMIDDEKDFYDILIQMSSAEVQIRRVGEEYLKNKIKEHILDFPEAKNKIEAFELIERLLDRAKI